MMSRSSVDKIRRARSDAKATAALLHDASSGVRRAALLALGEMGQAAAPHAGAIAALLQDEDAVVRGAALQALVLSGEAALHAAAVAALLHDEDDNLRCVVLHILGSSGEAAAPHAAAIIALLQDEDSYYVFDAAVQALGKLAIAAAPAIAPVLQAGDASVRVKVVRFLGDLSIVVLDENVDHGATIEPHALAIAAFLQDENANVRCAVLHALGRIREAAAPHAVDIAALLLDADTHVKLGAMDTLKEIGKATPCTLDRVGEAAAPHTGAIIALLQDENSLVRSNALQILGMASVAAACTQAFAVLLIESNPRVLMVAIRLIAKHELLGDLKTEHEESLLKLQYSLPQGAQKTEVLAILSKSRKLRGHAAQASVCQHTHNLSNAELAVAFDSMKQLTRQRQLTARHVETLLARCISGNAVDKLVLTLNKSQVRPVAIFPHLHQLTKPFHAQPPSTLTHLYNHQAHYGYDHMHNHLQAIVTRCSRWRAKVRVFALLWKQSLPHLPKEVVVSIVNTLM